MGLAEMVGSMGLTLFCNKCVEVFYNFKKDGDTTDELKETCKKAINSFRSFKYPQREGALSGNYEMVALFNTDEEVKSFEQVMVSEPEGVNETTLDKWIKKLEDILNHDISLNKRKQTADELQKLFDALGNYSFYASRESLRSSETWAGM